MNLIITTPNNPQYSGETYGVRFTDGRSVVNDHSKNRYGYSPEQLATLFSRDLSGYSVEVVEEEGAIETPKRVDPVVAKKPAKKGKKD